MGKGRWILVVFLLIGLGMLAGSVASYRSTQDFIAGSAMTMGTVVELERDVSRDSDGNRSVVYHPVVRYSVNGGREYRFRSNTGSNPPAYRQGEEVEVLYQPTNPGDARINGFFALWGGSVILGVLGLAFTGMPAATFFFSIRRRRMTERLKAGGKPVLAMITGVARNRGLKVNGRSPFRISTQWENPATGKLHVFQSDNLWFDPSEYLPEAGSVTVFIDADKPSRYWMDTRFLPELAD